MKVYYLLMLIVAFGLCECEQKDLSGYQVVRVKTDDDDLNKNQTRVLDSLDNIFNAVLKRDVWK